MAESGDRSSAHGAPTNTLNPWPSSACRSSGIRRFIPSTVSRCVAVVTWFYRTCVIDGILEHPVADHVRRRLVPGESPTLGLSHDNVGSCLCSVLWRPCLCVRGGS
jgi:hypothetical protein